MTDQQQKQKQQQLQQQQHDKSKEDQQESEVDDLGCVRDIELTDDHTLVGFPLLPGLDLSGPCHCSSRMPSKSSRLHSSIRDGAA
jgi:hypothetical protein